MSLTCNMWGMHHTTPSSLLGKLVSVVTRTSKGCTIEGAWRVARCPERRYLLSCSVAPFFLFFLGWLPH